MKFDVIIIGAGPVGSTVAEVIAKEGHKVLILEEHSQIGFPQHCTGKISVNASKELNLPMTGILHEVRGATFYSPDMNSISIERKDSQAYIFDRTILDRCLSERALNAGATLFTNSRVINVSVNSHTVNVQYKRHNINNQISARIVICADGAGSSIAKRLNLYSKEKSRVKIAIQRELTDLSYVKSGFVEVYLGRRYAPGFFAWIVPTGRDRVKVGLCINLSRSKHLLDYLNYFIMHHPIAQKRLEGGCCKRQTAHIIPTGGTLRQTVSEGILIVGDAAGHVKSTTGGGLYYGMICAKIAGRVVTKALFSGKNILRKKVLIEYHNLWKERLGKEIEKSVKIRLLLESLTDNELNYLFNTIRENKILLNKIIAEGDIDWQSKLSIPILKHISGTLFKRPQLLLKLGKFLIL